MKTKRKYEAIGNRFEAIDGDLFVESPRSLKTENLSTNGQQHTYQKT